MIWRRGDDYHLASEPPGFFINKAFVRGRICYMAVRAQVKGEPLDILHVERNIEPADETGRRLALDRCKAACRV